MIDPKDVFYFRKRCKCLGAPGAGRSTGQEVLGRAIWQTTEQPPHCLKCGKAWSKVVVILETSSAA